MNSKSDELAGARSVRELKKKLCKTIFLDPSLDDHLVKLNHEQVCAICASQKDDAPTGEESGAREAMTPNHLAEIEDELFLFDLCASDATAPRLKFRNAIDKCLKKQNMDIYTAQQIAMKRAKALYDRLCDPDVVSEFKAYRAQASELLKFGNGDDNYGELRQIKLIMIGASVTSVTFHATLADLMRNHPDGLKFEEIFVIKFVDVYLRPLERLMQARDRTVVPRFEYERLFDENLRDIQDAIQEGRAKSHTEDGVTYLQAPQYLEMTSPEATKKWDESHPDMPTDLRWSPGNVRSVAKQIADGHEAWVKRHGPKPPDGLEFAKTPYDSMMDFMANWFVGIEVPNRTDERRGQEIDGRFFSLNMNKYGNAPGRPVGLEREDRERAELNGDVLFRATGLGVDVPGDLVSKITRRHPEGSEGPVDEDNAIYDFPSEQRSYWDPTKPELDVQEEKSKHILVVGNSDAAAGALFSTLLKQFDSCTFAVLADMLWRCDEDGDLTALQDWFADVQAEVKRLRTTPEYEGLSTSDAWTKALHSDELFNCLTDSRYLKRGTEDIFKRYLRSGRSLYLGIRSDKDHDAVMGDLKTKYGPDADTDLRRAIRPDQRYVMSRFLENAWPENRVLGFILRSYITLLLMNYSREGENPLEIRRLATRKKRTYELTGSITEYGFGGAIELPGKTRRQELKYVINCGGTPYFNKTGNTRYPDDHPLLKDVS